MDDGIGRSDKSRSSKQGKFGFIQSLKRDWFLLLRGFRPPRSWSLIKGRLSQLNFQEETSRPTHQERLAQLSEAKKTLNQRIEKINRQLELLKVTLKGEQASPVADQLIQEGQQATRELQLLEIELNQLRRLQKASVKKNLTAQTPDLRAR